jgi:hypothetical protein
VTSLRRGYDRSASEQPLIHRPWRSVISVGYSSTQINVTA